MPADAALTVSSFPKGSWCVLCYERASVFGCYLGLAMLLLYVQCTDHNPGMDRSTDARACLSMLLCIIFLGWHVGHHK